MAYDSTKPANDGFLAEFPPEMREQLRAIINDQIVDALKLQGLSAGNASGNIPINNGNVNVNLNAQKLQGKVPTDFAPANWIPPVATASTNGAMSNTDKAKLDTVATNAEVNQNAFTTIKVGTTDVEADAKQDVLELVAGTNIVLTPDAINDRVTIGLTGTVDSATNATTAGSCTGNAATATNATNHISATANAHAATAISTTATGTITAGTVQSAIASLETNKVPTSDIVTTAAANKILKLNSEGTLPCDITGNAATASAVAWTGITGKPTTFAPPVATASVLGGVKVGSGLSVGDDGTITVPPPTTTIDIRPSIQANFDFIHSPNYKFNTSGTMSANTYNITTLIEDLARKSHTHMIWASNCNDGNCYN